MSQAGIANTVNATVSRNDYVRWNTARVVRWRSKQVNQRDVTVVGDPAVLHAEVTDVVAGSGEETYAHEAGLGPSG